MGLKLASKIRVAAGGVLLLLTAVASQAQGGAPSSIQIFMPGGGLPDRAMRFELTRDDGRIETLFTDINTIGFPPIVLFCSITFI